MKDAWWKEAVVYQVYPRSFMDANGDGIGDIKGIMSKLDYIKSLGVDAIWFSPLYKSPQEDMGYDIADYKDIAEEYGTLDELKELLEAIHARGMKVILDGVFNHCGSFNKWLDRECIYENAEGYEKGAYVSEDSPCLLYTSPSPRDS